MSGLLLPTGSKQPLRGDTALSLSPPSHTKVESPDPSGLIKREIPSPNSAAPASYGFGSNGRGSRPSMTSPPTHTSVSTTSSGRSGHHVFSAPNGAAALAFIPRTARNSATVQKPISQCSEFELEQRLDRNERILSTLDAVQTPTKDRLRSETEAIRNAILSLRAMRDVNDGISSVQLIDPSKEAELESALLGLSFKEASELGTSPSSEAFGWSRDTVAVKKRLAQSSGAYHPGRKVQAMGYEQSLAIQTAALLAERERERRTEESRLKGAASPREKPLGVPSGAAHKLGRKSISSCSGSMRKHSTPHSVSPPKSMRAGGPFARNIDPGPEHDAGMEGGDSDQDNVDLYNMPEEEDEDEDPDPGPRHEDEDEGFSFGRLDEEDL